MEQTHIGNTSQLFDVRQYRMLGGRSEGVRAVDVWNGGNLFFTVLPDRGMDIFTVRYKGENMAFHTPSGVVAPEFYSDISAKWLRSFGGGFLCTCGLQNVGDTDDSDPELTVHGRISNTPAEDVCVERADDGCSVRISGLLREGVLFGSKLTLKRVITCERSSDVIHFTDTVTNLGYTREALSMLYHFNMGWPLLSENAVPFIPASKSVPRTPHAASDPDWKKVLPPQVGFEEMCWYHFLRENTVGIDNPDIDASVRIKFDSPILDRAIQWRMFGTGDYVMGLEPASCTLEGRRDAVENGSQKYIEPRTSITNRFELSFSPLAK